VAVDHWGRASLRGLWACGEAASTGAHGANRLASNSLLEALVFGARVAESARGESAGGPAAAAPRDRGAPGPEPVALREELRELAWRRLGLVRDGAGLADARERLAELWRRLPAGASETRNLVFAGMLVAAAAERREESRGAHFRSDYPAPDESWRARQLVAARVTGAEVGFDFERAEETVRA
jgi:L-aspartate oxidase